MNVIRMENAKVRPIPRGRGRGKGRDQRLYRPHVEEPICNTIYGPKYQSYSSEARYNLFGEIPTSSSAKTPSNSRRIPGLSSTLSARLRSSASTNLHPNTSTSASANPTVIMAITSGRGDARCEVGMAAIDVTFPHLIISQISDSQTYVNTLMKIHLFNPIEIIMPETMCGEDDPRKKLFNTIKSKFEAIHITPISRMHFNEETGLDRIKTHCANEFSSIELFVKEKYYGLAATAALLKYVEHIQHIIYEPSSMKIEFQASQGATLIDVESAMNLELVSSQGPHKNHNLFSSLDRCVTPMGRRLLRSSILQPPCDEAVIRKRQLCVTELVKNRNLHTLLQPIVKQLFGADRLLSLSMRAVFVSECVEAAERNLNYILLLKTSLEIIPQLYSALEKTTSPNLIKIRENLKDSRFQKMKDQILEIIQKDARSVNGYTSANMQRCFALKSGINDMLDVARQTYCELIDQTRLLVESLAQEHHLPLIVACNASLGYHIQMDIPKRSSFQISDLPPIFVEVQKKRNNLYMTTDLLMALSQQCNDARDELHLMSNCILEVLISSLRTNVISLFQLSEDIAELDLVMSLARISAIPDYVKPNFGHNLRIIESKHPILDIFGTELPRPNNIEASIQYNFHNITGPNMSGKTTYLKQLVLLHIMAQIGCYLPATEARIRIVDRIFCRLCPSHEDIESNASAFIQEIKEIEYILQFVTPNSLIVLDEICRSTNAEEGSAIAFAICEKLLQTTAFIFNCSHFIYLTKLTELYHNVINHYLKCVPNELDKWGLKYTYKLMNGVTCVENYGISAASAARMPKPVIDKAKQLVVKMAKEIKPLPLVQAPELSWQKDCYACISRIMELIITDKYTIENIQFVIEPLRGHKRLEFLQIENNGQTQNAQYFNQTEPSNYVSQNNARPTNSFHYNEEVSVLVKNNPGASNFQQRSVEALNILRSNTGAFNVHQISVETSNVLQSNSRALDHHQMNNLDEQMDSIGSNLNPHQSHLHQRQDQSQYNTHSSQHQHKSQNQIQQSHLHQTHHSSEFNQQNIASQQLKQNSPFKMPLAIRPTSSYHINMQKVKQIEIQKPIRKPDISSYALFKNEFDFPKNKFGSSDNQDFQLSSQNKNKSSISIISESEISNSLSSTKEMTSNISSYPTNSKLNYQSENDDNSRRSKLQNLSPLNLRVSRNTLLEDTLSRNSSFRRNLQTDQDDNSRRSQSQNLSYSNLNSVRSLIQGEIESRNSSFRTDLQTDQDDNSRRSKSQNLSYSNLNSVRSLVEGEMESQICLSKRNWQDQNDNSTNISENSIQKDTKRSKLDFNSEKNETSLNSNFGKNEVSQNSLDIMEQTSLSSFNTANLTSSLGFSQSFVQKQKSFEISSQTDKNHNRSQHKTASQKSKNLSHLFVMIKESFLKKKRDSEDISSDGTEISEFESISDAKTLQINDISEFSPSPQEFHSQKQETMDTDIQTISSVDSIEAAKSARKKEAEIFNQIEDANDEQMFFQRMFNSPLSMNFSEELCSCDYEFTP